MAKVYYTFGPHGLTGTDGAIGLKLADLFGNEPQSGQTIWTVENPEIGSTGTYSGEDPLPGLTYFFPKVPGTTRVFADHEGVLAEALVVVVPLVEIRFGQQADIDEDDLPDVITNPDQDTIFPYGARTEYSFVWAEGVANAPATIEPAGPGMVTFNKTINGLWSIVFNTSSGKKAVGCLRGYGGMGTDGWALLGYKIF